MALMASNRHGLRYLLKHAELRLAGAASSCLSTAHQDDAVAAFNKTSFKGSLEVEKGLRSDKLPIWAAAGTAIPHRDEKVRMQG